MTMTTEELKAAIKANVKWDTERPPVTGGQQCGIRTYPTILRSEELDLEIKVGYHRSQIKNKELTYTLFELALDELVK